MVEHSLQADLSPEEINDQDILKATVRVEKTQDNNNKRIVSLKRIKSEEAPKNTIVNIKLEPEWYRVACGLSIVLGFNSFEDYVSDCIETNIRMYLMGGDDIDERFHNSYKHLVFEDVEKEQEKDKE